MYRSVLRLPQVGRPPLLMLGFLIRLTCRLQVENVRRLPMSVLGIETSPSQETSGGRHRLTVDKRLLLDDRIAHQGNFELTADKPQPLLTRISYRLLSCKPFP